MQHRARGNVSEVVAIELTCQPVGFCQLLGSASFETFQRQVFVDNSYDRTLDRLVFRAICCVDRCVLGSTSWLTMRFSTASMFCVVRAERRLPLQTFRSTVPISRNFFNKIIQPFSVPVLIRKLLNKFSCTVAFGFPQVFAEYHYY